MPLHLNRNVDQSPPFAQAFNPSRRTFLGLCAAGSAGLLGGFAMAADGQPNAGEPHRRLSDALPLASQARTGEQVWALASDTHISGSLRETVRGSSMAANLQAVVADMISAGADHVVFDGDVAYKRGKPEDYSAFAQLISPLVLRGTPVHLTLGNHDDRGAFTDCLGCEELLSSNKACSSRLVGGVQWLFLDSLERVNGNSGRLGSQQLAWLSARIQKTAAPAIVCLHHNPEWSLRGLRDYVEFLDVVRSSRRAKLVIFGHTHEYRVWQDDGLHLLNLPAVGYWKKPTPLGWVRATVTDSGAQIALRRLNGGGLAAGPSRTLAFRTDA